MSAVPNTTLPETDATDMPTPVDARPQVPTPPHLSVVAPPVDERQPTGEPGRDTPPAGGIEPETPLPPMERVLADWRAALLALVKRHFGPPDVWKDDSPSVKKVVNYGRFGQQVPDRLRPVAVVWSWFAAYHVARGHLRAWLMARPARAVVSTAVVVGVSLTPEGRQVLTYLLWPEHEVIHLITNW